MSTLVFRGDYQLSDRFRTLQIILPGLYIGISSIAYIDNTAVYVFTYCSLLLDRSRYLRVHVGNFVNALANSIKSCSCFLCVRPIHWLLETFSHTQFLYYERTQ